MRCRRPTGRSGRSCGGRPTPWRRNGRRRRRRRGPSPRTGRRGSAYVLKRGSLSQKGARVEPGFPSVLNPPGADAPGSPAQPPRPGQVADPARPAADGPRHRQPALGASFRPRNRRHARRLRRPRRSPDPPRIARLAGRRAGRKRLVAQARPPAHGAEQRLPAGLATGRRRRQAHRPGEPSALAHEPPPARRRGAARRRAGDGRHAQPGRRRADGQDAAGAGGLRPPLQRGRAGRPVAGHARPAPAHAPQPLPLLETQPSSAAFGGVRPAGHAVAVPGAGGQHVRPAGARPVERAVPARAEQGVRVPGCCARRGRTTPPAWTGLTGWRWAVRRATRSGGRRSTSWRRRRSLLRDRLRAACRSACRRTCRTASIRRRPRRWRTSAWRCSTGMSSCTCRRRRGRPRRLPQIRTRPIKASGSSDYGFTTHGGTHPGGVGKTKCASTEVIRAHDHDPDPPRRASHFCQSIWTRFRKHHRLRLLPITPP